MTHFVIHERKMACFELPVSAVVAALTYNQNEDIWNIHGSLTLNIGKLICDFRNPWYAFMSNIYVRMNILLDGIW